MGAEFTTRPQPKGSISAYYIACQDLGDILVGNQQADTCNISYFANYSGYFSFCKFLAVNFSDVPPLIPNRERPLSKSPFNFF